MPRVSPYLIELSPAEKAALKRISQKYTSPYYRVIRAKIILLAAQDLDNKSIGEKLNLSRQATSKWRKRFFEQRLAGLADRARIGRPPAFPPTLTNQAIAIEHELPGEDNLDGTPELR
jgi:hypothetical protein